LALYLSVLRILDNNGYYINTSPKCEPQLGKRGLYHSLGGLPDTGQREMAMLWVLNLSDGENSLLDIAERADLPFDTIHHTARLLTEKGLLRLQTR
jgi:aminopeptidase-like protein